MISVGQQLGGYSIVRRIGGGGMGDVFLAEHRRVARRAVIKALIPELSAKESVLELFFREARNTSLIRHPGIVEILDCDVHDGQAFIIMEFLEGESLGAYLKRSGALQSDLAFLLGVTAEAASAVAAAHAVGIMHRDLQPENIYLRLAGATDPTVSVKVLDFGIAKLSRDDGGPSKTKMGVLLGSPAYMSPEQCRGLGQPDARSDIYSLGCVLYEGLCGRPPFVARALGEFIVAHATEAPRPPTQVVRGVPAKLNALILKMLSKAPGDRPQAMNEVIASLRDCAQAMAIDFEGPLLPIDPVLRPTDLFAAPPRDPRPIAAAATSRPAQAQAQAQAPAPAPAPVPPRPTGAAEPVPAPPPVSAGGNGGGSGPGQPLPATWPMPMPAPRLPIRPGAAPPEVSAGDANVGVGGTLILDHPFESKASDALQEGPRRQAAAVLPGGTLILGEPTAAPPRFDRPAPGDGSSAPAVGGTKILDTGAGETESNLGGVAARAADRRHIRHQMPAQPYAGAPLGGAVVTLPAHRPAWYATIWQERPRLMLVVGGCVVFVAVVLSALLSSTGEPSGARPGASSVISPDNAFPPEPTKYSGPAASPGAGAFHPGAPVRPDSSPEDPASLVGGGPTVRIDVEGVPPGTTVSVDGRPAVLPIRVPRGRETHRIALHAPGGVERSIDVDGSRDRIIEMLVDSRPRNTGGKVRTVPRPPQAITDL